MIDHITINVKDYKKSVAFYREALAPLGITALYEEGSVATGFGKERPQFWVSLSDEEHPRVKGVHVAFMAATNAEVDAFYAAAMVAGAKDNGAPGYRPQCHSDYYGAFVLDLDGNNIEAVCHG